MKISMTREKYTETSNVDRQRIVNAYIEGNTSRNIAAVMTLKRTTIDSIIKTYRDEDRVTKVKRGGLRPSKLSIEQKQLVRGWVDDDCTQSLSKLKNRCLEEFNVSVSEMTICRIFKEFEYTIKRVHLQPERRNNDSGITSRREYAINYLMLTSRVPSEKIYFLDEVGFCVAMRGRRGRSLRGTRAVQVVPGIRTRNISICCAMNRESMFHHYARTSPFNTVNFLEYLQNLFQKFRQHEIYNTVLILDNVPFHRSLQVRQLIQDSGHQVLFLPPYSPFLNPIENIFSKWKEYVRREKPQNEENLIELIDRGGNLITNEDCNNCYLHMTTFLNRCINNEIIIDE